GPWGFGAQWGYYTDGETGLILCTFRFYDPATGRFLNRDPIGYGGGINLYTYCGNGPLSDVDPTGEYATPIHLTDPDPWYKDYWCKYSGFDCALWNDFWWHVGDGFERIVADAEGMEAGSI